MRELMERIRREGVHVGEGIVKLDSFLNHQVDAGLTERMGAEFFTRFTDRHKTVPSKIVTAEVSGIPPALATARMFDVPLVYARKHRSSVMTDVYYLAQTVSRTHGDEVNLMISKRYLNADDQVLIIDDFLATGSTITTLASLIVASCARLLGIGCVIEKPREGGRLQLTELNVPIETLARIDFHGEDLVVS